MSKQTDLKLAQQYFEEARALDKKAKYEEAMCLSKKSIVLYKKWKFWEEWVRVGNVIGLLYSKLGDYEKGFAYLQNVLEVAEKNCGKEHQFTGSTLNNIGISYHRFGKYDMALEYFQAALVIKKIKANNRINLIYSLNNIGLCYLEKSDYDNAILYFQEVLRIRRENHRNDDHFIARALGNIAKCFRTKGEYDHSIKYQKEGLSILRKTHDHQHPFIATALLELGAAYSSKGDSKQAIVYYQEALNIKKKIFGNEHPETINCFENLGVCYHYIKSYDLGIQCIQEAIFIREKNFGSQHPKLAISFLNIGNCYAGKENYMLALEYFQKGLILLNTDFQDFNVYKNPTNFRYVRPSTLGLLYQAKSLNLFRRYREQTQNPKDLLAALDTSITAAEFIVHLRQSYKMEGSKYTLAEKAAIIYNQAIETVLEVITLYTPLSGIPDYPKFPNFPRTIKQVKALVFNFSEQCKAILLLSNLKNNEAKAFAKIPTVLLEQEKEFQSKLNELESSISKQEVNGNEKEEALISQLQSQHFKQKQQYDALIEKFEVDYPEYHQLKYSITTASIQDLQSYLQETNTTIQQFNNTTITQSNSSAIILSYHIGKDKIYIFAITSNDYQITTIEKPADFSNLIEKLQGDIQLGYVSEFIKSATQLFDILLQPVWDFLQESSKLIIIPHGELYYVPFDVLFNQHQITDIKNFENLPYLIRDFDISYHYSATLLLHSHQRQQQTGEQVDSFFGLAPVHFGGKNGSEVKEGYVVKSSGKQQERKRRILKSSGNEAAALQDLEETEVEVKEVYQLFEEQGKEAIALFYDQANKQNLQEHIGGYKYVLISTHGFLQETSKNTLSGIHLAPSGARSQESGVRQEELASTEYPSRIHKASTASIESDDYILHTSETYHLNLNADLVVLSSCESGVGELKVGEGMMALNRGFLYAGASNIVYSLFKVPEDSTSRLTQALFRYILEGENYAQALRKAKLELINDGAMEPMDWAGFALVGG